MKILGLSGTNGAGKDTVGEYLASKGWLFISVTDLLRAECQKRGLKVERENLRKIGDEWRKQYGLGVLMQKAYESYQAVSQNYSGLVISSLRNPGEADKIHSLNGKVIWVDADPKIRYERINNRQRGDEDRKTFEEFMAEEQVEMHHSGDDASTNMIGVKEEADIFVVNDGSREELMKTLQSLAFDREGQSK